MKQSTLLDKLEQFNEKYTRRANPCLVQEVMDFILELEVVPSLWKLALERALQKQPGQAKDFVQLYLDYQEEKAIFYQEMASLINDDFGMPSWEEIHRNDE